MNLRAFFVPLLLIGCNLAHADIGIVVYESKGVDARRTSTGHVALIATHLCAEGIDQVRVCAPGEEPGVVVTRYANLAYGYDASVFVRPIRDHFMATGKADEIPALSSGGTLDAMQIEYWRTHLRTYLPPLSQERYEELKAETERFEVGRTIRKLISMELLIGVLGPHKKKFPTEPIALIDPATNELIPNGRWREAIGAAHMRSSILITAPASPDQEQRLIPFIQRVNKQPFQALTDNCSDFVERSLLQVFSDSGLRFRPRIANVADAWITSPIEVATDFLNYSKRERVPITVTLAPMLAGTRRPTAAITSISRGALIPNPSQGKMAFGMKIYFNTLNPLLGLTSYTVDKLSRFANLHRLVHERGGGELSRLAYEIGAKSSPADEERKAWRREQVRVFGTTSCWNAKRDQFAALTAQAREVGLLTAAEQKLVLKPGRPFLLPRLYERTAAELKQEGVLMAGMSNQALIPAGLVSSFLPPDNSEDSGDPTTGQRKPPLGFVPGRPEILDMGDSKEASQRLLAFKVMTSVINYDLSSEAVHRRISEEFDRDWEMLLDASRKNGLRVATDGPMREAVAACSCREFDQGKATRDAFEDGQGYWQRFAREMRQTMFGANR